MTATVGDYGMSEAEQEVKLPGSCMWPRQVLSCNSLTIVPLMIQIATSDATSNFEVVLDLGHTSSYI